MIKAELNLKLIRFIFLFLLTIGPRANHILTFFLSNLYSNNAKHNAAPGHSSICIQSVIRNEIDFVTFLSSKNIINNN
jgi:hypothetical protein